MLAYNRSVNRHVLAGLAFVTACSSGNGATATQPPVTDNEVIDARTAVAETIDAAPPAKSGIEDAERRALDSLAAERPDAQLEVSVLAGPGGVQIVRARDPEAYPGTGVAALVYDPATGRTYGKRGEDSLASLLRSRGWIEERLADADLIRLVHEALFDGILILKDPTVEVTADGVLQVHLPAHTMRGDHDRTWIVTLPATGDETVSKAP